MKYQGLYLMAAIVSCLTATLLFTADAFVTNTSSVFRFPLYISNKKTVVAVESDHDFYNRAVCLTGTPAPSTNCLTCFDHPDTTTCAADLNCQWNAQNNICTPK